MKQFLNKLKVHESFDIDDETCDDTKYAFKQFINGGKQLCSNLRNVALHQTLKNGQNGRKGQKKLQLAK